MRVLWAVTAAWLLLLVPAVGASWAGTTPPALEFSIARHTAGGEQPGAPVVFDIEVHNVGASTVAIAASLVSDYDLSARITAKNGREAPLTQYGQICHGGGVSGPASGAFIKIGPGGRLHYVLNLSRLYDLSIGGEYTATVTLMTDMINDHVPQALVLHAPEVRFRVDYPVIRPTTQAARAAE